MSRLLLQLAGLITVNAWLMTSGLAGLFVGCRAPAPVVTPQSAEPASPAVASASEPAPQREAVGSPLDAALAAYEIGDYGAALRAIERHPSLGSDARIQVVHGALLLFARRYEEASSLFGGAEADGRAVVGARVGRAHMLINGKDYEGAKALVEGFANVSPPPPSPDENGGYELFVHELACLAMGWAEANQNQHVRAIQWFDRILKRQPDDLLGLLGRANSLIALRLLTDADEALLRILDEYPDNAYAHAELGMVRLEQGDERGAEAHFRRALEEDDRHYTCPYEGLGLLYLRQGRTDEARENLEEAIRINPAIEYRKYNGLARIYLEEGNVDEAERLLEKSVANFPYDGEARELLEQLRSGRVGAAGSAP